MSLFHILSSCNWNAVASWQASVYGVNRKKHKETCARNRRKRKKK